MTNLPLIFILALLLFSCEIKDQVDADLLISNVSVVDVKSGQILPGKYVAIQGDRITRIHDSEVDGGENTRIIDGTGRYLIPGLWDMHTHFNWNYRYASPLLIAHGITGVREMWGVMDSIKHIRSRIASGDLHAPDVYSAGAIIDGTPPIWPGSVGVGTTEEAVAEVDRQISEGVDFLKVYSLLTKENYQAIAERSREKGIAFVGHIPGAVSIWEAMEAGQKSAEHLYGLLEACTSDPEGFTAVRSKDRFGPEQAKFLAETFNRPLFDSLLTVLAQSDTWLCPTLTVLESIANLDDTTRYTDPRLAYLPSFLTQGWDPRNDFRFQNRDPEYYEASRQKFNLQLSLMGSLEKAGVKILAGTDYPNPYCYPGFSLHDELQLMVNGGMSTAGALRTATYHPALFMDKEQEMGQVVSGQLASLVLLEANPLEDISNTQKIAGVFLRGRYFNSEEIKKLKETAKNIAVNTKSPF